MTDLVLDCSVTMSWCFDDEADRYSEAVLAALDGGSAIVPSLWPLEVANVLLVAERRGRLRPDEAREFLGLLAGLPITVDTTAPDIREILGLARAYRLSAYDAAYLDLAARRRLPLATRDRTLRAAARAARIAAFG